MLIFEMKSLELTGPFFCRKILQMVAIERLDTKEWAIPGGMVDPGEKVSETVKREFMEEALSSTGKTLFYVRTNQVFHLLYPDFSRFI